MTGDTAPVVTAPIARVLVIDDSVVVRRLVARAIESDPSLELAGVAQNGKVGLEKIGLLHPDVVVLDLEMPVMDGFETLTAVRRTHPHLPVIVFSHLTHGGAAATLDALALGATAFALKPRADGIGMVDELMHTELLPLISAVAGRRTGLEKRTKGASAPPSFPSSPITAPVTAVVVAVSTGGPSALADLVPCLPADLSVPVFVVQHMPPLFTGMLAERLNRVAKVGVVEAGESDAAVAGRLYVAPGGRHMALRRIGGNVEVVLHDDPPENSCRPAADVLFRSAAQVYGAGVVGVVLTGMGSDGLRGCELVRAAGGSVMVQDAESSVVASMPTAVAGAGLANAVLPLREIGPTLVRWIAGVRS